MRFMLAVTLLAAFIMLSAALPLNVVYRRKASTTAVSVGSGSVSSAELISVPVGPVSLIPGSSSGPFSSSGSASGPASA
jgi:hypothetical protein